MRRFGMALASVVALAAAGSAEAAQKIVDVTGTVNNSVTIYGFSNDTQAPGQQTEDGSGGSWDSYVDIGRTAVTFESSNAVAGLHASVTSSSVVTLNLENGSSHDVDPTLHSTITPAGFGFYIADQSGACGGNIYTGCAQANGGVFQDLYYLGDYVNTLGTASFQFEIFDGDSLIYQALGALELMYDPDLGVYLNTAFSEDALGLPPHTTIPYDGQYVGNLQEFGYLWGAKDLELNLATLGAGQSRTLTYKTSVTSTSYGGCTIEVPNCLVAYSGFGDPIGRGGAIDALRVADFGALDEDGVTGVTFTGATFNLPTFDDETGDIVFTLQQPSAGVPEPGAWALMILGFGAAGGALRRARRTALA
jgi:hypothetical protein